ncbi:hypothetical protein SAMN02910431_04617 [Bacteroides sp. AR20]|nr:hypothetical protein SAMN02910431_04617 [Bacteroides sp. AR20]
MQTFLSPNKATKRNMDTYRKFVSTLATAHSNRVFLNSDKEHALIVLIELFKNAKSKLRIFAGSLCHHVGNTSEYVEALSDFIERGGSVDILLNNFDIDGAKRSNLFKRLAYYVSEGKPINVKTTTVKPYLANDTEKKPIHFTIGDESSYRIETNTEERTAECNFNNPVVARNTAEFFDELFNLTESVTINLTELFNIEEDDAK